MSKISAYAALTSPASSDVLPVVDISDTSMAASGTTKKITVANLAAVDWLNAATMFGADPSGVADSTTAIQNAINAIPAAGGTVYLPAGTYKVSSTLTMAGLLYATLRGAGRWATTVKFTGTGDCLRIYNTDTTGVLTGGALLDFTIDGTSAGNSSAGLHFGDMRATELRLAVLGFSGTSSIGIHFDNQNAWTEECHGYLWLSNNTQNLVFDVSGATTSTNSFGYNSFDVEILAKQNQDGVVLANGALYYNSRLAVRGNFQGTPGANTSAVVRVTGTVPAGHPNAGNGSKIIKSRLDVLAECSSGPGSNAPQTIVLAALGTNTLLGCTGILDFSMGNLAFAVSNWTATGGTGSFIFTGPIAGDFNLNNSSVGLGGSNSIALQGAASYGKSLLNAANGNTSVNAGDFFSTTLTGNTTVSLNPGGASTLGAAQRKVIVLKQAAAGGPYTVTWPVSGSPSTSSPTIVWQAGAAPVMSTAASAVDVYYLDTYDGATWFGQVAQTTVPSWTQLATTGAAGYALINGTGNIITYTAPSDGALHRVQAIWSLRVTSGETGGQLSITCTFPDASAQTFANAVSAGGSATGAFPGQNTYFIQAGTTFTVKQNTALTAGAAVLWAELWGQ